MERTVYMAPERVDTKNKKIVDQELEAILDSGVKELVFDMANMKYISSAGLRILIDKEQKLDGGFYLAHVPQAVKEILEVTGFTNIMKIL